MDFVHIQWQSELYQQEVALRNSLLRRPLGLSFSAAELAEEQHQDHYGLVHAGHLLACTVIVNVSPSLAKLRQMAVRKSHQRQGLGAMLISRVENILRARGCQRLELHARVSVQAFYQQLDYQIEGEEFIEVSIPHIKMAKAL